MAAAAPDAPHAAVRRRLDDRTIAGRVSAALIGICAWTGLALFFVDNYAATGSAFAAAARMAPYFTILTNLGLAIVFTGLALGPRSFEAARVAAGAALAIAMVGVVFFTLLRGEAVFTGASAIANVLVHLVTPILTPLHWLLFVRKGALRLVDPWLFALYPLTYLGFVFVRGAMVGTYPYQFLNVARFGVAQTLFNALPIAAVFFAAAWILLLADRRLARRSAL